MDSRLQELLIKLIRRSHNTVLPDVLEEKMVMDLYIQLEQKLDVAIIEELSVVDTITYENMLQNRVTQSEMATFLMEKTPNIQTKLRKLISDFEEDYITTVQWQK